MPRARTCCLALVLLASCGGAGDTSSVTPPPPVSVITVALSPSSPTTAAGGIIPLTASVSGSTNGAVTWDLPGGATTGSVAPTGTSSANYTAPAAAGSYTVRATSVADVAKSASVTVVVSPGSGFRVTGPPRIAPATTAQFSALFNDSPVSAVWIIDGAANGCTISSSGLFTAGASNTSVTLRATDASQPTRTATQLVTVASQVTLSILGPSAPTLTTADMVTFYWAVSPTGVSSAVTWSTNPAGAGAIIPVDYFAGFIPPSTTGVVTVTARSVADPTVTASFTATVTTAAGPAFTPTASPSSARYEHTAATMPDGRIVLIGGQQYRGAYSPLSTTEVFNPATGSFGAGPALVQPRWEADAVAIDATRVLVTGGWETFETAYATGEIIDLSAGTSTQASNAMSTRRAFHQTVKLSVGPNAGKIAILGGFNGPIPYGVPSWQSTSIVELFDGATNRFSAYPASMKASRGEFTATTLADGRILIAGGYDAGASMPLASAEIFDPVAGTFTFTGTMSKARVAHTATRLADSKVLIVGGVNDPVDGATAELYNPATGLFEPVNGTMQVPRHDHAAALMSDGRVAIFGGVSQDAWVRGTAEVYDPVARTFSTLGRMAIPRRRATASVLTTGPNAGRILVFGGGAESKVNGVAEIVP